MVNTFEENKLWELFSNFLDKRRVALASTLYLDICYLTSKNGSFTIKELLTAYETVINVSNMGIRRTIADFVKLGLVTKVGREKHNEIVYKLTIDNFEANLDSYKDLLRKKYNELESSNDKNHVAENAT